MPDQNALTGNLGSLSAINFGIGSIPNLGNFPNLGQTGVGNLASLQNPQAGMNPKVLGNTGMPAPQNFNPMMNFRPPVPSNQLIPGSPAHAMAFHAKGPDFEIKLFVGGLAF